MRRFVFVVAVLGAVSTAVLLASKAATAAAPSALVIEGGPRTLVTIDGTYPDPGHVCDFHKPRPLRAIYRGSVRLELSPDGTIRVIDTLSFSSYLRGLAEVPTSWPPAALRAQVIAARSYAMDAYKRGRSSASRLGYDICSTDQCQVYRGASIEQGPGGSRWVQAVEGTRGSVLTYNQRVIQAFFFSTSTGTTRRSFPGGTPEPWLPSVSGEDGDAPLAHWTAHVRLADVAPVLRASGIGVGSVTGATRSGDSIVLTTAGGSRTIGVDTFRNALNNQGPCLFAARYPDQRGSAAHGPLPQTIPSTTFTLARSGDVLVVSGRGWGHGVGMSQFGARSMAARGSSAAAILGHFYGPARITTVSEPATLRVLAAQGLRRVHVTVAASARITLPSGNVLTTHSPLTLSGGTTLGIRRVVGRVTRPVLDVVLGAPSIDAVVGTQTPMQFTLSNAAAVHLELRRDNVVVATTPDVPLPAGLGSLMLPTTASDGTALTAGRYSAVLVAADATQHLRAVPVAVTLNAAPVAQPTTARRASRAPLVAIAIAVVVGALALLLLVRRRLSRT